MKNPCVDELLEAVIFTAYKAEPHCFIHGCGKETLMFWVQKATNWWINPKMLRQYMLKLVQQRYFKTYISHCNYRCFELTRKGRFKAYGHL